MSGYLQKPGGGGGGGTWGSITGTLSNQTDLQNALNAKQNTITTGTTAQYFRGDLSLATFPTNVSTFTNDSGYITSSALSGYLQNNVGIAGGTTLIGGTASGNNLTLSSTSNATKGKIVFGTSAYDEVNNRLGIGTSSPSTLLDIRGNAIFGTSGVSSLVTIYGDASNTALRIGNNNSSYYYDIYREGLSTGLLTFQGNQSGATGYLFKNEAASGKYFTFSSAGRFGINVLNPTASLQLPAGTATAGTAPLKLTSGTNLTTPENGTFEFDGTNLYFTVGGVRKTVTLI